MDKVPVSVLITTKNEEKNIARCLASVTGFDEVIVIDSGSTDRTCTIAQEYGARVENFTWNGQYPKKRQWCLDHLTLRNDWVLWVDADEELTPELITELHHMFSYSINAAGFFIKGQYVWRGRKMHYGMMNNKIILINKCKMEFPVVDDLRIEGMGEMEGHYQPVLQKAFSGQKIGQILNPLIHHAYEDEVAWEKRHKRYARWEADMTKRNVWPRDPVSWRERAKKAIRKSPLRPWIMFAYSYVWKRGVLDGRAGLEFALSRKRYCDMILKAQKNKL